MRSKTPLALMEQAIMVLVFALAAALCLRVFVWSDRTSRLTEARDRAAIEAQTVAETIKNQAEPEMSFDDVISAAAERLGDGVSTSAADGAPLEILYDSGWAVTGEDAAYVLRAAEAPSDIPGLSKARVWVTDGASEDVIFEITVAWQREAE